MFSSDKILQEIVYLLSLNGGRMNLLKLMKELYLIDRASIDVRGSSISGDSFYSMPHGPVLSQTLNMIQALETFDWKNYLSYDKEADYYGTVGKKADIVFDRLSKSDRKFIEEVSEKYKNIDGFKLEEYTHTLPEWEDPHGSSKKIRFRDVMQALDKSESEIIEAKEEYEQYCDLCRMGSL